MAEPGGVWLPPLEGPASSWSQDGRPAPFWASCPAAGEGNRGLRDAWKPSPSSNLDGLSRSEAVASPGLLVGPPGPGLGREAGQCPQGRLWVAGTSSPHPLASRSSARRKDPARMGLENGAQERCGLRGRRRLGS